MERNKMIIKIDPEFKALIPALSKEEYDQLEKNCIDEDIREPIVVWLEPKKKEYCFDCHAYVEVGEREGDHYECLDCGYGFVGEFIIVDGHNRYEIAEKHDLEYETLQKDFDSRDEVIDWMINNQLGRRNLSKETQSYLRGLQYQREKKKKEDNLKQNSKEEPIGNFCLSVNTAQKLSEQHGVSERTIRNDEQYAIAVDTIVSNTTPEVKQMILNDRKMTKEQAIAISQKEPEKQKEIVEMVIDKNIEVKKAIQEVKRQEIKIEAPKVLNGLYDIIYADPPWKYDFAETESRAIENHYPTMDLEDIKNIKIPSEDNSVLLLWATAPKLLEAIEVITAWGFTYKTQAVWDKELIGSGYWFRGQHEILIVATKGKYSPPVPADRVGSVYREKRTAHSKKPSHYYDLIESMFPQGKYLEMFCRSKHNDKWEVWGNQCE
jgi:N6-adenosine-specific RNA methylase IME4